MKGRGIMREYENVGCLVAVVILILLFWGCLNRPSEPRIYTQEELNQIFQIYSVPSNMLQDDFGNLLLFSDLSYRAMQECCEDARGGWANDKMPYRCVVYPSAYSKEELASVGVETIDGLSAEAIANMSESFFTSCVKAAYKSTGFDTYIFNEETFDWEPINPSDFFEIRSP